MDTARLSSKGQITIPIQIRRKLGLREGDKVIFVEQGDNIVISNADLQVLKDFQKGMEGAADEAGWTCEQDVINYCKEIRREMWEERYANNG
ncbi:MAG: AbrB/MazE/SpoVT family DNA-binding domain-containing protein [Oscillospiraceae bacterium]|nr:AbrB/MazE/SpoVT family DNA-binding domain-containing protein [Oscillospiraceae bacterium]